MFCFSSGDWRVEGGNRMVGEGRALGGLGFGG